MGLTVHYKLAAPAAATERDASRLVAAMRRMALRFQRAGVVEKVFPVTSDPKTLRRFACEWLMLPVPGQPNTSTGVEVPPIAGFIFPVRLGADCEPLWLGLCHYPSTVPCHGRQLRTKRGARWRLSGFSKTQYASLHGWEHFFRCHSGIVEILRSLRAQGCRVRISDEGEYWPRRSPTVLREKLEKMNRLVAATAGALRDHADQTGAADGIQSPIFAHPGFEHLEAHGAAEAALHTASISDALTAILDEL